MINKNSNIEMIEYNFNIEGSTFDLKGNTFLLYVVALASYSTCCKRQVQKEVRYNSKNTIRNIELKKSMVTCVIDVGISEAPTGLIWL